MFAPMQWIAARSQSEESELTIRGQCVMRLPKTIPAT
jgi:hypothetical protein